jgi:hypothetical protein
MLAATVRPKKREEGGHRFPEKRGPYSQKQDSHDVARTIALNARHTRASRMPSRHAKARHLGRVFANERTIGMFCGVHPTATCGNVRDQPPSQPHAASLHRSGIQRCKCRRDRSSVTARGAVSPRSEPPFKFPSCSKRSRRAARPAYCRKGGPYAPPSRACQ